MLGNRVKETTETTGTGTITLGGAVAGFVPFSAQFATGELVDYNILDGNDFETGKGVFTAPSTLARTLVLETIVAGVVSKLPALGLTLSGAADVFVGPISQSNLFSLPNVRDLSGTGLGHPFVRGDGSQSQAFTANFLHLMPFYLAYPSVYDLVMMQVDVVGAGKARVGLYRRNIDTTIGDLIFQSGDLDISTTGNKQGSVAATYLPAGWYYSAFVTNDGVAQFIRRNQGEESVYGGHGYFNKRYTAGGGQLNPIDLGAGWSVLPATVVDPGITFTSPRPDVRLGKA